MKPTLLVLIASVLILSAFSSVAQVAPGQQSPPAQQLPSPLRDPAASAVEQGILSKVSQRFIDNASLWQNTIFSAASYIFWTLGAISIVWTGVTMLLRKSDFSEFLSEFVKFCLFFGFFLWLLREGPGHAFDIIDSLEKLGKQAASNVNRINASSPDDIVQVAFFLFVNSLNDFSFYDPLVGLVNVAVAILILFFMVAVAINVLLLYVSAYLVLYAGIFILGFGGSRWTSEMAINYYRTMLGIGVQLMTCILIVSIGIGLLQEFQTAAARGGLRVQDLAVVLIFALVLRELTTKIPPMVAGMISGATGGQQIGAASTAGVAAAAAAYAGTALATAAQTAGAGSAVIAAAKAAMASDASSGFGALSRMRESDDVAKSAPSRSGSSGSAGISSRQSSAADAAGKAIPDSVRSAFSDRGSQSGAGQSSGSPVSSGSSDSGSGASADRSASDGNDSQASQPSSQGSDSSSSGSSSNGTSQPGANAAFASQDSPPSASSANSSMDSNSSASGSATSQESSEGSRSVLEQSASTASSGSAKPWEVSDGQAPQQDISQMSGTSSPSEAAQRDSSRLGANKPGSEAPEKASIAGRVGRVAMGTVSNLAGAAMSSIKEDLAKNTVGGRLADRIARKQREAESAEKNRNYIASAGPEFRAQVEELVNSTRKQEG